MKQVLAIFVMVFGLVFIREAQASVTVTVNGTTYTIPQTNEKGWGANVTSWIQAMSSNALTPIGGVFTLTNDVNLGGSFGLIGPYYKSRGANLSSAGVLRLANAESIGWRDAGNTVNYLLSVNSSGVLTFNGNPIVSNTALTASRALISDATGAITFSPVLSSELAYVSGVTSSLCGINQTCTMVGKTLTSPVINTPTGIVKGDVGLGNVDNTSDATKNSAVATLTNKSIDAGQLTGTIVAARIPNPSASTLGGVQSAAAVSNQWINSISTSGVPALSQPAFTNISGSVAAGQMPALTGDVTTSAGAVATTLATVNAAPGTFGSGSLVPSITVNAKGLVTAITTSSVSTPVQVVQTKTANYTALSSDDVILGNTNAITITLYSASAGTKPLVVCKIGVDTNAVTVTRGGTDTFVTGATSNVLHRQGECVRYTPDGVSKWFYDNSYRTESVYITDGGACTVTAQSGNWIASTVHNAVGDCSVNFVAGVFSSAPSCTTTIYNGVVGDLSQCHLVAAPSTAALRVGCTSNTGAAANQYWQAICVGPR